MRSLHLKGCPLCRLFGRFGYLGSVCFDEHFQHRSQHSSGRTAHKTRKILAIQSIHERYWIGKVKGSVEQYVDGLSSEIACVGLSFRKRNSSRAVRMGSGFSEFSECHWSAVECYLQFYVHRMSGHSWRRFKESIFKCTRRATVPNCTRKESTSRMCVEVCREDIPGNVRVSLK